MVEREIFNAPEAEGSAVVTRLVRHANGVWGAEIELNFSIHPDDQREILVRRYVSVKANGQRGRKAKRKSKC
jgi:hypothetical protein